MMCCQRSIPRDEADIRKNYEGPRSPSRRCSPDGYLSRLSELPDRRFSYDMKRALPDGRKHLVMTGVELLKKLIPLVPPTWANLTRFHGVFAPTSRLRATVVPAPPLVLSSSSATPVTAQATPKLASKPAAARSTYRLDWAALQKRVFAVDVMSTRWCAPAARAPGAASRASRSPPSSRASCSI